MAANDHEAEQTASVTLLAHTPQVGRGKRGRPRKFSQPTVPVAVRWPEKVYDALCRRARLMKRDVADVIRDLVLRGLQ